MHAGQAGVLFLPQRQSFACYLLSNLHLALVQDFLAQAAIRDEEAPYPGDLEGGEMGTLIQSTISPSFSVLPRYGDKLTHTNSRLQHRQQLIASGEPTLADGLHLVEMIQQEFGEHTSLEQVIQSLVGQQLLGQRGCRRSEEVAS
jgi:hypothetical protein